MRVGYLSLIVIAVISSGLTLRETSDVSSAYRHAVGALDRAVRKHIAAVERALTGEHDHESQPPSHGDTCALIACESMIVGLDCEGYVTSSGSASDMSDLPALTGFTPTCIETGQIVSTPEVVLGLAIIRAFELSPLLAGMLSEVNLRDLEHPRAILCGGTVVELGCGRYAAKVDRLSQVLVQATYMNMSPKRIDLRFGSQIVVECGETKKGSDKEA